MSSNKTFSDTNEDPPEVRQGSLDSSNNLLNRGQSLGVTVQDPLNTTHAVHDGDGEVGEQSESSNFTLHSNISHKFITIGQKVQLPSLLSPQDKLRGKTSEDHVLQEFPDPGPSSNQSQTASQKDSSVDQTGAIPCSWGQRVCQSIEVT